MIAFPSGVGFHSFMRADLRIPVKDYRRNKNLKVQLTQVPFASARRYWVRMNGQPWPKKGQPVSLKPVGQSCRSAVNGSQA